MKARRKSRGRTLKGGCGGTRLSPSLSPPPPSPVGPHRNTASTGTRHGDGGNGRGGQRGRGETEDKVGTRGGLRGRGRGAAGGTKRLLRGDTKGFNGAGGHGDLRVGRGDAAGGEGTQHGGQRHRSGAERCAAGRGPAVGRYLRRCPAPPSGS